MIANMNTAAMVDAIFSIAPSVLNIPSSKIHLPKVSILQPAVVDILRLIGGNGRHRCVEFLQRIAAPLNAGIEPLRP
jgi:hypothetical protein